jgi:hypothetical protein
LPREVFFTFAFVFFAAGVPLPSGVPASLLAFSVCFLVAIGVRPFSFRGHAWMLSGFNAIRQAGTQLLDPCLVLRIAGSLLRFRDQTLPSGASCEPESAPEK